MELERIEIRLDPTICVNFVKTDPRALEPFNAYGNDAGWDLFTLQDTDVEPHGITDIRTGLAVAIPDGFYGRIVARSSTWRKRGIGIVEGIIDAGFRGELFAGAYLLHNVGIHQRMPYHPNAMRVQAGESLCQLIIQEVKPVRFVEADLPPSERGEKGFGSSGN